MRVLVIAEPGPDDPPGAIVGELARYAAVCDRDISGDGGCGCSTLWVGQSSARYAAVVKVAELDLDLDALADICHAYAVDRHGCVGCTRADAMEYAQELADIAAAWPLGTRLRCTRDEIYEDDRSCAPS